MKYDVVIIGSGLGGLICARQLAQRGRSVVVLERQRIPGGCLQSYRRGELEFDTGLHYVGGLDEGQSLHDAFQSLGLLSITIGNQTYPLAEGFDHFADTLAAFFPQERSALRQFVTMLRQLPPIEQSFQVNAYDYLTSLFHDPLLVNVVSAAAMRMELRRESLPLFTFAHGLSSYIQSSWRLKGSGQLIVDSLIRDIEAAGGEVCCQTEVCEMREADGRIAAVLCQDGRSFEGDLFVSDVHPQLTLGWLKESQVLKNMFRRRTLSRLTEWGVSWSALVYRKMARHMFVR